MRTMTQWLGVAVVAGGLAAGACSDGTAPATPGQLAVKSGAASTARAVVLRVTGPVSGVAAPTGRNYLVYSDSLAGDTTMIMVVAPAGTTLGAGPLALIGVPNTNAPRAYTVRAIQASDASNAILGGAGGLSLSVGAP